MKASRGLPRRIGPVRLAVQDSIRARASYSRRTYVNDNGWIIGVAKPGDAPTQRHAVLLTPLASCPPGQCEGDIDGDGSVGVSDVLVLLADWGPCGDCDDCPADVDGDCSVGVADLLILLANWG